MSKRKILIVDDQESLCRALKYNLEARGGYEVRTETKSSNTLTQADSFKPELIILDMIMPGMDGGDVAQELKADARTQEIPIIFLTAIVTKQDEERGRIGDHFVLAKPVNTEKLIEVIERTLTADSAN